MKYFSECTHAAHSRLPLAIIPINDEYTREPLSAGRYAQVLYTRHHTCCVFVTLKLIISHTHPHAHTHTVCLLHRAHSLMRAENFVIYSIINKSPVWPIRMAHLRAALFRMQRLLVPTELHLVTRVPFIYSRDCVINVSHTLFTRQIHFLMTGRQCRNNSYL